MRQKYVWDYGLFVIKKYDGNNYFYVESSGMVAVRMSLRGAKQYVAKKLKKNYHDLKINPKVLPIDSDKNI